MKLINVIDAIYKKYPCIENAVSDAKLIMATTEDACEMILRSPVWIDHLKNQLPSLYEEYKDSILQYGAIIPKDALLLSQLQVIKAKFNAEGVPIASIPREDIGVVYEIARTVKIRMTGNMRNIKQSQLYGLIKRIEDVIGKQGFRSSSITMLKIDKRIKDQFRLFLHLYVQNMCYLSRDDIKTSENIKEIVRLYSGRDIFAWMNMSSSFMTSLVDDNLAQTFPELYQNSKNEWLEVNVGGDLVPDGYVKWEERPEFPHHTMIWILRQHDYFVTNFLAAKTGYDTVKGTPDYDVYGQLICTSKSVRSAGIGKLLLLSTILMARQYKVNYVFIQAFQGITGVQTPLYNRVGFRLHFTDQILKRKTGFYQWSLLNDSDLDEQFDNFLKGTMDPKYLPDKITQLGLLQPMWLNVRTYDTSRACKIILLPGYDYHTNKVGPVGKGVVGKLDIASRIAGLNVLGRGEIYDETETDEALPKTQPLERKADGAACSIDDQCLSDFCVAGRCAPFPYNARPPEILQQLDKELKRKGIYTDDQSRLENRYEEELNKRYRQELYERNLEKEQQKMEQEQAIADLQKIKDLYKVEVELARKDEKEFEQRLKQYNLLKPADKRRHMARLAAGKVARREPVVSAMIEDPKAIEPMSVIEP